MLSERLKVVCVIGSGKDHRFELTEPLGLWLAELPVHLLTGGGQGVMAAVSKAYVRVSRPPRIGLCIGIIPGTPTGDRIRTREGYPNDFLELVVRTHLPGTNPTGPESRNHLNALSADVVIALPGGQGTAAERELAKQYDTPVISFSRRDEYSQVQQRLKEILGRSSSRLPEQSQ